jgi:hypothetical protein
LKTTLKYADQVYQGQIEIFKGCYRVNLVGSACLRRYLSDRLEGSVAKSRCSGKWHFHVTGMKSFKIFHLSSLNILVENALSVNLSIHLQTGR